MSKMGRLLRSVGFSISREMIVVVAFYYFLPLVLVRRSVLSVGQTLASLGYQCLELSSMSLPSILVERAKES